MATVSEQSDSDELRTQSCLAPHLVGLPLPTRLPQLLSSAGTKALTPFPFTRVTAPWLKANLASMELVMMLNKFFSWQPWHLLSTWEAVCALCCPKHS